MTEIGGHSDDLQIKEDEELSWRLTKAGYRLVRIDEGSFAIHLESPDRFTLGGVLKRAFSYAYWYHMLFYKHPCKVGLAAWPIKMLVFSVIVLISVILIDASFMLILTLFLTPLMFLFRFYKKRESVRFTFGKFESRVEKMKVFLIILLVESLIMVVSDVGRIYGMLDKVRAKTNFSIR